MNDQIKFDTRTTAASIAGTTLPAVAKIEKFSTAELTSLRNELMRGQLDSWQAADVAGSFLAGHGYGASSEQLRAVLAGMEVARCSIDCLQTALEGVAYIQ